MTEIFTYGITLSPVALGLIILGAAFVGHHMGRDRGVALSARYFSNRFRQGYVELAGNGFVLHNIGKGFEDDAAVKRFVDSHDIILAVETKSRNG